MNSHPKGLVTHIRNGKEGFTLVELLVVVGIIVALAAVIIPSVVQFAGKGSEGAQAAESDSVQTAIDTLMADVGLTGTSSRIDPALSANDFSAIDMDPTAGTAYLSTYLREDTTTYFYCWDANGLVTRQDTAAATCPA
ncbi:MAG: prepilin-type N-terminal cleavage/methylation domain-containing protein [Chloroflexi bacterium]|nr:prepilin-type N-terminal cleavage/methylation domain-containing protein [Chloroflexota bacterium]